MNQRGFLVVGLLVLLPLILTAFLVIAAAFLVMKADAVSRHACRVELLRQQAKAAEKLEELLKLNGQAKILRIQRTIAEQAARVDPTKVSLAALVAVRFQQGLLAARQNLLIVSGKYLSLTGPDSTATKVVNSLQTTARLAPLSSANVSLVKRRGQFKLRKSPANSITPNYTPAAGFSRSQIMTVRWSFPLAKFLPPWIGKSLHAENLQAKAECSATLEKENGKWTPKIIAAKSLLNFW